MKRFLALVFGLAVALGLQAQTRSVISVGSASNDGSGDSIRSAFTKANLNFSNLWTTVYTNGTGGGGGGTNYLFDTNWFSVSGTNVTIRSSVTLTNNLTISTAAKSVYLGPLDTIQILGTNVSAVGYTSATFGGPTASIVATTEFDLQTPAVSAQTATVGQFLKLVNATTGKAEFATASFLPLSGGTLTGALDMGSHKVTSVTDPTSAQDAATKAYVDAAAPGIVTNLRGWTQSAAYQLTSATYDSDNVLSSATVTWPDGSSGTFTRTTKNSVYLTVDAFTITHSVSGKTVTQSAVTRNSNGSITAQPALSVAP